MSFSSNGISSPHKSELEGVPWVQDPQGECVITTKGEKGITAQATWKQAAEHQQ